MIAKDEREKVSFGSPEMGETMTKTHDHAS